MKKANCVRKPTSRAYLDANTFTIIMLQFLSPSQKCANVFCQLAGGGWGAYNNQHSVITDTCNGPQVSSLTFSYIDLFDNSSNCAR